MIRRYTDTVNTNLLPFGWTKCTDDILTTSDNSACRSRYRRTSKGNYQNFRIRPLDDLTIAHIRRLINVTRFRYRLDRASRRQPRAPTARRRRLGPSAADETRGHERSIGRPRDRTRVGDIRDLNSIRSALAGCGDVYHCAAMVPTIEGNRAHRQEVFEYNVLDTRNVLLDRFDLHPDTAFPAPNYGSWVTYPGAPCRLCYRRHSQASVFR